MRYIVRNTRTGSCIIGSDGTYPIWGSFENAVIFYNKPPAKAVREDEEVREVGECPNCGTVVWHVHDGCDAYMGHERRYKLEDPVTLACRCSVERKDWEAALRGR